MAEEKKEEKIEVPEKFKKLVGKLKNLRNL